MSLSFSGFKGRHYAIIGGFLTALSVQIASIGAWGEATSPLFVAGIIGQLGVLVAALNTDSPEKT